MQRIAHVTRAVNLLGPGRDGFSEGDPDLGLAPTVVTADFLNSAQEEVARAVELLMPLEATNMGQLAEVLLTLSELSAVAGLRAPSSGSSGAYPASAADDGFVLVVVGADQLYASTNGGLSFSQPTLPSKPLSPELNAVCHGPGLFVAVGKPGLIYTSPDALTWTKRTAAGGYAGAFRKVVWFESAQLYVALGATNSGPPALQTSPDGVTWTARVIPSEPVMGLPGLESLACITGRIAASVGYSLWESPDGVTWSEAGTSLPMPTSGTGAVTVAATQRGLIAGHNENINQANRTCSLFLRPPDGSGSSVWSFDKTAPMTLLGASFRSSVLHGSALGRFVVSPRPYTAVQPMNSYGAVRSGHYWVGSNGDSILVSGPVL